MKTCNRCNGTGHDRAGQPEVKFEDYVDKHGNPRKRHITVKQGSGCLKCGGLGHEQES